jgi:ABC-type multidrug transport system ATPase subunit
VESAPQAYRLKASNAASPISTFSGAMPPMPAVAALASSKPNRLGVQPPTPPILVPANDQGSLAETLDDVKRTYWMTYRRDRPRHDTVAFAAKDVTKSYGRGAFKLEPLSFELRVGEITGVVGRNASGKTTLLRIVKGDLLQDSGTTEYPLLTRDKSGWRHIKRQIADVPQFPERWRGRLRPNLNYVAAVHGIRGRRNKELVDWHVGRYGLAEYEDAKWDEISGGYKVRFELARALVTKPKLLVLDEPLAYLDVMARQEFLKDLLTIATSFEEPVPIIITSQHLYEIEAVVDQLIIMDDGRCIYAGPQAALGTMVPRRLIEITLKVRQSELLMLLEPIGMKSIEQTLEGFIVEFDKAVAADEVYRQLYTAYGARLIDFRDITTSARALFEQKSVGCSMKG